MRPLLEMARDGKEHALSEARENLAERFKLTEDDRNALLPSGRASRFNNRVAWARVYLGQAGVTPVASYETKKIDSDYFSEE
jgi:restriction system protein